MKIVPTQGSEKFMKRYLFLGKMIMYNSKTSSFCLIQHQNFIWNTPQTKESSTYPIVTNRLSCFPHLRTTLYTQGFRTSRSSKVSRQLTFGLFRSRTRLTPRFTHFKCTFLSLFPRWVVLRKRDGS